MADNKAKRQKTEHKPGTETTVEGCYESDTGLDASHKSNTVTEEEASYKMYGGRELSHGAKNS